MKKLMGVVVSLKNKDTAIIAVERFRVHPIYEKRTKNTKRYPVHNLLELSLGDSVEFKQSRPYSKTKKWITTKIIANANIKDQKSKIKSKNIKRKDKK